MDDNYFFDHLTSSKYDRLAVMGDFNLGPLTEQIETFVIAMILTIWSRKAHALKVYTNAMI